MAGMRRGTSRDPVHDVAEEQGVDEGGETGSEQGSPLPHRHERLCENAHRVGAGGAGGAGVSGPPRAGRDDARAAPSAFRFGYPGDGNGVIM
jgi:hypothetical protein